MVEFLEEGESAKTMDGVDKISFLFVDEGICGPDVFKTMICLVGMIDG